MNDSLDQFGRDIDSITETVTRSGFMRPINAHTTFNKTLCQLHLLTLEQREKAKAASQARALGIRPQQLAKTGKNTTAASTATGARRKPERSTLGV